MICTIRKVIFTAIVGLLSTAVATEKVTVNINPDINLETKKLSTPKTKYSSILDDVKKSDSQKVSDGARSALSGGESSGGGGMSLIWNGEVRLLDLVHQNDPFYSNAKFITSSEREATVRKTFYSKNLINIGSGLMGLGYFARHGGWVSTIGIRGNFGTLFYGIDGNPLNIGDRISRQSDKFPILAALADAKCNSKTPVLLYQKPLNIKESAKADSTFYSKRFPEAMQQPLAFFYDGTLIVSAQLFSALDEISKTALGVHECLRHLDSQILQEPLTTSEIEAVTRYIMNSSFDFDRSLITSAQKKMEKPVEKPSADNRWLQYYKIEQKCALMEKERDLTWDERWACYDARNARSNLYYSDKVSASKERLFCIMENAAIIPGWNESKVKALSGMDIRDVYDYFKKAEMTIGTCEDSLLLQ